MAKREKKPVHKVQMTEGKRNIIQMLLQEYDIESAQDIQDGVLKNDSFLCTRCKWWRNQKDNDYLGRQRKRKQGRYAGFLWRLRCNRHCQRQNRRDLDSPDQGRSRYI